MHEHEWLAKQFEAQRPHLQGVAYRMLGSLSEADDAVQESWFHISRSETSEIKNMRGWLTTVVARICLDMLRSRKSRREDSLEATETETITQHEGGIDPEQEVLLADSVGLALLVVLDTLNPAERLAFVLHDVFALPFDEIAPIVEKSETATRQLASRARRRVRGGTEVQESKITQQKEVVEAFLVAARTGNFAGLLAALDPDVVLKYDSIAINNGNPKELRGAETIAKRLMYGAQAARIVLINGSVGIIAAPTGRLKLAIELTFVNNRIVEMRTISEPEMLQRLELVAPLE